MGLFSGKKKIYVSSVTYNLAGDEKDQIRYIPTTVLSQIIANTNFDLADTLRSALLNGPGMRMRTFGKWSRDSGYSDHLQLQNGQIMGAANIDTEALAGEIPHATGERVNIDSAEVGGADYAYWAEQWMAENHPSEMDGDFELDFSEEINTIYIRFTDGSTYSFQPVDFDPLAQYLYCSYILTSSPAVEDPVWDPVVVVDDSSEFPPTTDWDLDSNDSTPGSMTVNTTVTTVVSYSDDRPDETSETVTPSTATYTEQTVQWSKTTYEGTSASADESVTTKQYQKNMRGPKVVTSTSSSSTDEDIGGGVIKTTTVTTAVESLEDEFSYQTGIQTIITKKWSARKTLIYKYQSGNAVLDAMFGTDSDSGVFFPFIPIRQGERFISETFYPETYERNLKAYPKALGKQSKYPDMITKLKENSDLSDVDHGFIVFGVSLNTKQKSCLRYVYKYFQSILASGNGGTGYDAWKAAWNLADVRMRAWVSWKEAQADSSNPLFGTPEPEKGVYPAAPTTRMRVYSSKFNYNMTVSWNTMVELVGTGLGKADAKVGDIWWTQGADEAFNEIVYSGGVAGVSPSTRSSATLTWQDSATSYRSITTTGLHHTNIVYKGKGVDTSIGSALKDADVSAFIVPLHEGVFRAMSLVDATQMSQGNAFLVLNSYEVVKQKWYQTGWFKVVIAIVIIVVSVFFPPAGAVAGAGILGPAAGIGAALGFSGTWAIVVGAIANAVAAMVLTSIIQYGATALFGEKIGAIVGAIAGVVAVSVGTAYMNGGSIATGFANLTSAENVLKLTNAVGGGIAEYIGADTQEIINDTQKIMEEYNARSKEINDLWQENLGYGEILFDPMQLTNVINYSPESPDTFLNRTLLTGSDIADFTNNLLSNFTSITLSTELS